MKIKIDKTKFKFLREDFPEEVTKEELQVEIERLNTLAKYYNNKQLAEKTIINSSYGALASKYFVGFNIDVAASVTEMGRNIVKFGAQILNKYFSVYWHLDVELHKKLNLLGTPSKIERLVQRYGDTDSVYLSMEDVVADLKMRNLLPEKYKNDIPLLCYDIVELGLNDYINRAFDTYAKKFNTKNIQKFELENILYNVIFLAKKKYVGDLAWKEGSGFVEPNKKLKITGIEIIQSSTPKFCRTHLQEMLNYIFKHTDDFKMSDFILMLNDIKRKFKIQPIEDVSFSKSLGNYEKFILEDKKEFKIAERCPIHVRGGGYHNYLINNSEQFKNKYKKIKTGDKIKFYHAKDSLCNVFSFLAGDYPYEIAPEIDFDLQFEKTIIAPINRILYPLGVGEISPTLISSRSLF